MGNDAKDQTEQDAWLLDPALGIPARIFDLVTGSSSGAGPTTTPAPGGPAPSDDKDAKDGAEPTSGDPAKAEADKQEKQQADAGKPNADKMADAAKDLLKKYAEDNLGPLKEKALADLAKAWKDSPGGVIAAGVVLGAAGVTYLVKTGDSMPSIPAIPLDFLASRVPAFKGAELNIEVKGPVTGPESFKVSITFHEQGGSPAPKAGSGKGKALTPRMTLRPGDAKADSPEIGTDVLIEGSVPIPPKTNADDAAATIKAIQDGKVEVDLGGTPTNRVQVLSVTDSYRPTMLSGPPAMRSLSVRLKTSIPPMLHQGKDEIGEADVWVRINGVSNEGGAKIKVHWQPFPSPAGK